MGLEQANYPVANCGSSISRIATNDADIFARELETSLARLDITSKSGAFTGRMNACRGQSASTALLSATPLTAERTSEMVEGRTGEDICKLVWQIGGRSDIEQAGRSVTLQTGDIGLYDISTPYKFRVSGDFKLLILGFSRSSHAFSDRVLIRDADRHNLPSTGMNALKSMLMTLLTDPETDDEGGHIMSCASQLASRLLTERSAPLELPFKMEMDAGELPPSWHKKILNLQSDPDLTPDKLAQEFGISRRSLYNSFAGIGSTPAAYIRTVRLHTCRKILESKTGASENLAGLALDFGFKDQSHFTRAFRREFGVSPGQFKREKTHS
ncbi:AraC-like DNA-binding protein [Sulfitobacter undariae]|uniref:AraC-like DNA-binding protein n=1 Tax=Sulfitobacter undariae TaxID=1563671 RepID=A0A7W6E3K1_9RHOB|nr:helix-turn-helix domain-containing protein [Sulfitobacter undariae]MBB3992801.1 AraC-like DNA-binding protein [Sulfitobacter undariae]